MIQYLIVLLDDTSISFCNYQTKEGEGKLITLEDLKKAILFGMKGNMQIQFVYPQKQLPTEYSKAIETIDHCKIRPFCQSQENNVVLVLNDWNQINKVEKGKNIVLRTCKADLFSQYMCLIEAIRRGCVVNLVIDDVETFGPDDFQKYSDILAKMVSEFGIMIEQGLIPQLNILTDRLVLREMNNCGAGDRSITLAPNGKFYICPAFYYENENDYVGDLSKGLNIENQQLYKLSHSPICSHCDAFQCKRCVWLNRKMTLEVNTPSYEQCVVSHLERNASRALIEKMKEMGKNTSQMAEIKEIDYLDPLTKHKEWQ